jgi:heme exporter protein A
LYDLSDADDRIDDLLEHVGLVLRRRDLVRTFSRGMKQRLALARAVLHRPSVLLLDEPYTGLDPGAAEVLTALLIQLAGEGCSILMTTHNLDRGLTLGQRVVLLSQGEIVLDEARVALDASDFSKTYRTLTT